jgi:hypothetical protein
MILWQSLQVEAYRDDQGPASASGYVDQHERLPGTSSMICRGVPRRMRGPPMIIYPTPVGLVSRGRSPKGVRCRRRTGCLARGSG